MRERLELAGAERGLPAALRRAIAAATELAPGDPQVPGAVYQASLARGDRRAAGVFYTPPHLVDLAVEAGLGRTLDADDEVRVVLDPACGAGVFLVAALARLEADAVGRGARPGPRLRAQLVRRVRGIDRDPIAVELARLALAIAVAGPGGVAHPAALAAVRGCVTRADALAGEPPRADVVLGNPPWGQKGFALPPTEVAALRARFRVAARGVIDPFAPFVELAHRALRPGGRWALILPEVVLLKNQAAVRGLILAESALELIAEAGRAFPGVNLDAVVIAGRRGPPPRGHRVAIWHAVPAAWRAEPPPVRHLPQRVFAELPGKVFNLHLDVRARAALRALGELPRLGERFEIHEGVHSGNARARLFVAARPSDGARLIVGRDELRPYRLRWAGGWLDRSPAALDRARGDYANLGQAAWFAADKIVVRRTGDRVIAAFDGRGHVVSNNLFVVLPRGGAAPAELAAVTALLNSRLMTWYFRTTVPRVGRRFAELKIHHLAGFPLPPPARLAARVPRLAELAAALAAAAEPDPALAAEVDAEVESLYPASRALAASIRMRA